MNLAYDSSPSPSPSPSPEPPPPPSVQAQQSPAGPLSSTLSTPPVPAPRANTMASPSSSSHSLTIKGSATSSNRPNPLQDRRPSIPTSGPSGGLWQRSQLGQERYVSNPNSRAEEKEEGEVTPTSEEFVIDRRESEGRREGGGLSIMGSARRVSISIPNSTSTSTGHAGSYASGSREGGEIMAKGISIAGVSSRSKKVEGKNVFEDAGEAQSRENGSPTSTPQPPPRASALSASTSSSNLQPPPPPSARSASPITPPLPDSLPPPPPPPAESQIPSISSPNTPPPPPPPPDDVKTPPLPPPEREGNRDGGAGALGSVTMTKEMGSMPPHLAGKKGDAEGKEWEKESERRSDRSEKERNGGHGHGHDHTFERRDREGETSRGNGHRSERDRDRPRERHDDRPTRRASSSSSGDGHSHRQRKPSDATAYRRGDEKDRGYRDERDREKRYESEREEKKPVADEEDRRRSSQSNAREDKYTSDREERERKRERERGDERHRSDRRRADERSPEKYGLSEYNSRERPSRSTRDGRRTGELRQRYSLSPPGEGGLDYGGERQESQGRGNGHGNHRDRDYEHGTRSMRPPPSPPARDYRDRGYGESSRRYQDRDDDRYERRRPVSRYDDSDDDYWRDRRPARRSSPPRRYDDDRGGLPYSSGGNNYRRDESDRESRYNGDRRSRSRSRNRDFAPPPPPPRRSASPVKRRDEPRRMSTSDDDRPRLNGRPRSPPRPPPPPPHIPAPPLPNQQDPEVDNQQQSQTGLGKKPAEDSLEAEERPHKRPRLARENTIAPPPQSTPPPLPTFSTVASPKLPPSGARTPNINETNSPKVPAAKTPAPAFVGTVEDNERRKERKRKRELFPDRSRIGSMFKEIDVAREEQLYGKKFEGVGKLSGYSTLADQVLGQGTFGKVIKAKRNSDGLLVALKLLQNPNAPKGDDAKKPGQKARREGMLNTTAREIKNLKLFNHNNIVPLLEMIVEHPTADGPASIYLVFPYMEHDLCGYIHADSQPMSMGLIRHLGAQLMDGLAEMHRNKIVHRDLKTANILINNQGLLQIADFGLSRSLLADRPTFATDDAEYTNMVVTRWYRAPEILMGETMYGCSIDMWSIGCILAEMATKQVFIMGKSNAHQLLRIFHTVGYPSADWSRFDGSLQYNDLVEDDPSSKRKKISVQEIIATARSQDNLDKHAFASAFAGLDRALADLVRRLLNLDPAKRPSASEARNDTFFNAPPIVIPRDLPKLLQDARESSSSAKKGLARQHERDRTIDPFPYQDAAPPSYPGMAASASSSAYGYQPAVPAQAMMAGMMNAAAMNMAMGMNGNQAVASAAMNGLNTTGMVAPPPVSMPGRMFPGSHNPSPAPVRGGLPTGPRGGPPGAGGAGLPYAQSNIPIPIVNNVNVVGMPTNPYAPVGSAYPPPTGPAGYPARPPMGGLPARPPGLLGSRGYAPPTRTLPGRGGFPGRGR